MDLRRLLEHILSSLEDSPRGSVPLGFVKDRFRLNDVVEHRGRFGNIDLAANRMSSYPRRLGPSVHFLLACLVSLITGLVVPAI